MNRLFITCICFIFGLSTAKAHPGVGIVMDSKGQVFYTDLTHVWKISPDGNHSIAVKNVHTHELYIDEQGNLYGEHEYYKGETTDKWGNYVWCLSSDGVFEITIPEVEGFLDNNTLVRDLEENSYWATKSGDYQVLNKSSHNGQTSLFSAYKFKDVRWMHYSITDKNLYVVDNLIVKKVSPTGKVDVVADGLKDTKPPFNGVADRHYIFGIWTSVNKGVYIAVFGGSEVKYIGSDGEIKTIFESEKGWSPCGGITDPNGTLWIMEFSKSNTTRVRKIKSDGKQTVYGG